MTIGSTPHSVRRDGQDSQIGRARLEEAELANRWVLLAWFVGFGIGGAAIAVTAVLLEEATRNELLYGVAAGLLIGVVCLIGIYSDQRGTYADRLDHYAVYKSQPTGQKAFMGLARIAPIFVMVIITDASMFTVGVALTIVSAIAMVGHIIDRWFVAPAKLARETASS